MNITIREIDDRIYREFKAEAAREGEKIGEVLAKAMLLWIEYSKKSKKKSKSILDLKPFDWGPGNENASMEIDKILYGDN